MANILNLALKKDVYEGLMSKTSDKIPLEKSNWWKKRLVDLDTGSMKEYDIARVSCGSPVKTDFKILNIENNKNEYLITVSFDDIDTIPSCINPVEIKDDKVVMKKDTPSQMSIKQIQEEINKKFANELNQDKKEYTKPEISICDEPEDINPKETIKDILNLFFKERNVFVVNTPMVIIRKNGQVVSSGKELYADSSSDTIIPFGYEEVTRYNEMTDDDFVNAVSDMLHNIIDGNYVFVKKGGYGFTKKGSGEDVFYMRVTSRKTYLFRKRR